MMARFKLLGGQNASSTNSLDFLLSLAGEETSLHDDGLLGESLDDDGLLGESLHDDGLLGESSLTKNLEAQE